MRTSRTGMPVVRVACVAAVSAAAGLWTVCASGADAPKAADAPRVFVSAPARIAAGSEARVEALFVNASDAPARFEYEARLTGLKGDEKTLKRAAWLAGMSSLPVAWLVKGEKPGEAAVAVFLDGREVQSRKVRVELPEKAILAKAGLTDGREAAVGKLEAGRKYRVALDATAGAKGELVFTLARMAEVAGLDAQAVISRSVAPAALGGPPAGELDLLYALQDRSGGWGAAVGGTADVRTTSWVLFWLGSAAKAGTAVDAKAADAAVAHLRKAMTDAAPLGPDMRARALTALSALGKAQPKDAEFLPYEKTTLTMAGRLLAIYGGAKLDLPPRPPSTTTEPPPTKSTPGAPERTWRELNCLETAVLMACLADGKGGVADGAKEAGGLLPQAVALRGADPKFDTHEAALYALALSRILAATKAEPPRGGDVEVRVAGRTAKVTLGRENPSGTAEAEVELKAGEPGDVTVRAREAGLFWRVRVTARE